MTKKILLIILGLLLIVIGIFSYNFYKNVKKPLNSNAIVAVPQNAALIIQGNNFKTVFSKLTSSNIIWEELVANSSTIHLFNQQLSFINSLITNPTLEQITSNEPVIASIHQVGANGFDAIYYFSTSNTIDADALLNKIQSLTKTTPTIRNYDDVSIYNFKLEDQELSLIYEKGIIAFSYSSFLIEDVVRQLQSPISLLNDESFVKVFKTAGESEVGNVFINTSIINKILNPFLANEVKPEVKEVELFCGWIALDATIKSNAIMLNGFSLAQDSSNFYLSLFKNQKPQENDLINVLPYQTAFIYYNSFSDPKAFFKTKKALLNARNQSSNLNKLIDDFTKNYQLDIEEEWDSFLGNEIASILTEPMNDSDYTPNKFIVCKIKDSEKATNSLKNIGQKINLEPYAINLFNDYAISKIDLVDFFPTFFGKPFFNINHPYYSIMDDYLIFGTSESALQNLISNYVNQKTLSLDLNFQSFKENLASTSNIFIYNNIARSVKLYPHFLNKINQKNIAEKTELLQKFEAIAFQLSTQKNNLYYNNIYLKYNPVYKKDTRTVWETMLEGNISSKPEIVLNHLNNTKEIFVQDDLNKVYLLSNTGKILWTKQLADKIIGRVNQVDALKNNKLQLLFNTSSKIYLLDRNGNDVGKFPIVLPSPATNGITPMDYENNKNYRLLIGCENNMLYNYDIEGNKVAGWEYAASKSPVTKTISHLALGGKDYVVVPLQNGTVKIIERSGKDRLILKNKLPKTNNPVILKVNTELKKVYLITLDSSGNSVKLYFNDAIENTNFGDITKTTFFDYYDVNLDNNYDNIFAFRKSFKVFDSEKQVILSIELPEDIMRAPLFFKMPDKAIKIGLVTASNIYLINSTGKIENNFPLAGSTPFCISNLSNDNSLNLVVGDKNLLYMYNLQ